MAVAAPRGVLRFGAFSVDLERCVLLRGAVEVPLRRQAFDMLRYLAENRGRLVTKDDLVQAIWRKAAVSDDSLVRCIKDIRDALGDGDHRIVETVRGRGYRFAPEVSFADAPAARRPFPRNVRGSGWRIATLLAGAALVAAVGVGAAMLRSQPGPDTTAAHHAILGHAIISGERSAKANREALAHFGKALAIDPSWVPALVGYASVLVIEVGGRWVPPDQWPWRLAQAEAAVARALRIEPQNARAHQLRGILLRMKGEPQLAVASFERALQLNPANPWTHAEYGRTKIDLGRAQEALADMETALRLNPSEAAIHVWYFWAGMAALHAGQHDRAVEWLHKALELRPSYPHPVPLLAAAYAEAGQEAQGRALVARHLGALSLQAVRQDYPSYNEIVGEQRGRIVLALARLGVPERDVQTGSLR